MITIPFIILLGLLALKLKKQIRQHQVLLYILLTVIAAISFIKPELPLFKPIIQGYLALAFFYLVMLAGALPDKTLWKKTLMSIRKEYSILGFIAATPHGLYYFIQYINGDISIPIFGIIAYVVMIPLFITSFHFVRKRMAFKSWKKLQRFAYISYTLLVVHLVLNYTVLLNLIVFIIIFAVYTTYKVMKIKKNRTV